MTIKKNVGSDTATTSYQHSDMHSDQITDNQRGYYVRTQKGLKGPFRDLATTLNGIILNKN